MDDSTPRRRGVPPKRGGTRRPRSPARVSRESGADRPFRPPAAPRPRKPVLPEERPRLRRDVYQDLRGAARPGDLDDVARAYAAAGEALDGGDLDRAIELLTWAKSAASRSAAVREALGIALYLKGDYKAASSELTTYRRLSGREDQNHLLADCARALGRHDKVLEEVERMRGARVPADRRAEALLVLAGDRADRGDLEGAMAALEQADLRPATVQPYHLRVWHLAAQLAERAGDLDAARDYLEAIITVDPDFLDAGERLERLGG